MHFQYWLLVLLLPLALSVISLNHWYYLRKVLLKHNIYIKGLGKGAPQQAKDASDIAAKWIIGHLTEIKRIIEKSGVTIPTKTFVEPVGYGHLQQQAMSVIENILFQNKEVMSQARDTIEITKGYYLNQFKLWLNPLYCLEIIIFLPKEVLREVDIKVTSKVMGIILKLFQIIYWILMIILISYGVTR